MEVVKQASFGLKLTAKQTRKQVFSPIRWVGSFPGVHWSALVELIVPYCPEDHTGHPPFALETMLRIHFLQPRITLSDPAMKEAFFDKPLYREFAKLHELTRLPDESTILRFRYPEMHSARKGNPWHSDMKAHIGVDADSGLVHTVKGTSANVNDMVEGFV